MEKEGVGNARRPYHNRIMTFEYEGDTFHIWFRRSINDLGDVKKKDIKPGRHLGVTLAYIGLLDHEDEKGLPVYRIISFGKSVCVAPDQFVKETGRLIALRRAVDDLNFYLDVDRNKKLKTLVFENYLGRRDA